MVIGRPDVRLGNLGRLDGISGAFSYASGFRLCRPSGQMSAHRTRSEYFVGRIGMRQMLTASMILTALAWIASSPEQARAHGRHRGCGPAACGCAAACCGAPVECGAPCAPACAPQYVERTVTCYRPEYRTREVPVTVYKLVPHEEKFTYIECVPVTRPEKRTETFCTTVTKQVPFTYTVCVPVSKPEKRVETYCTTVTKQVPYTYTVCVPVTRPEKRVETYCTTVTKQVPYTYTVCVPVTPTETRLHGI